MSSRTNKKLVKILIKFITNKYKKEEFIKSMHMYMEEILKQPDCISYNLYQNLDEENAFLVVSKWESHKAMEKHFQTREFELLLGATKVLCNSFEIQTTKVLHIGDLNWARRQIRPTKNTGESQIQ